MRKEVFSGYLWQMLIPNIDHLMQTSASDFLSTQNFCLQAECCTQPKYHYLKAASQIVQFFASIARACIASRIRISQITASRMPRMQ